MPPDDSNKNIFSSVGPNPNSSTPPISSAEPVMPTQNVWGQPPIQNPSTPVLPTPVFQNDNALDTQPPVVQPDPNKNIWGQPLEPSLQTTPVLPEPMMVNQNQPTVPMIETTTPVVKPTIPVQEPVMSVNLPPVENTSQPEPIQKVFPQPEVDPALSVPQAPLAVTPTFNPYGTPPPVIDTPSQVESFQPASQTPENPILQTDVPELPKKGFPKVILALVALMVLIVLAVFGIKAFLNARAKTAATESQPTEITWWGLWEEERVVKPLIDDYQAKNPKVKITYVKNSQQDYRERLANALAKGTGPDIFYFHNTWVPMFSKELDAVPGSVVSISDYQKNYLPVVSLDASRGTGFVGLPLGYDGLTLFINTDIFAQEGVDPPTTWVEVREVAKKLTKTENGQIVRSGVALGRTENVDHWQDIIGLMFVQNRVSLVKPEGKKAEDALKFFSIFSSVDKVWDETLPPSTQAFATGKLAMYFGPSWRALTIKELNPNLKFKTVPLPQLPKEDPNEPDIAYASYWFNGVWTRGKNKTLAWDFMKFISSKESMEKMYQLAANSRGFGVAYPRMDMKDALTSDPIVGSVAKLAPYAKSWYLASRTFDGTTGINSQLSKYFEDAINAINQGVEPTKAMQSLTPGVVQVLQQYGLTK